MSLIDDIVNPALLLAIDRMKLQNNEATQNKMVEEVLNARFLVPSVMKPREGAENEPRTAENSYYIFDILKNSNGGSFYCVFTDKSELQNWPALQNRHFVVMNLDDLHNILAATEGNVQGFVINPGTSNITFLNPMIEHVIEVRDQAIKDGVLKKLTPEEAAEYRKMQAEDMETKASDEEEEA